MSSAGGGGSSPPGVTSTLGHAGGSASAKASASATGSTGSSSSPSSSSPGRLLRSWFLSLSKHERGCMLVLEDAHTVHTLLRMFARVQQSGDGYFYGGEEVLDRISDSSGRQHHLRHHHGSSLLCTAGRAADCSFCGCNAPRDVDVLAWLNDQGDQHRRHKAGANSGSSAGSSSRHRSSSGSGGGFSSAGHASGHGASESGSRSLLNGLNLADSSFSLLGSSMSGAAAPWSSAASSSGGADGGSSFMFSSRRRVNPFYHSPPDLWAREQELERSVRLCDTRGYCDTLCVMSDLLSDGASFLSLMDAISKNGFLVAPCYTTWDPKNKVWLWDVTAWFRKRGYYSLGTYLANKLEMVLWMRYWEHTGADPRKVPSGRAYVAGGLVRERLSSKSPLAHFWSSLASERREKMLAKLGLLVEQQAHSLQQQYLKLTQTAIPARTGESDDEGDESASNAGSDNTPNQRSRRIHAPATSDTVDATSLQRARSHSLPRRPLHSSSGAGLPPASPTTPSSTSSAPSAMLLRSNVSSSATPLLGGDPAQAHGQSPWSSLHSSFASSLTTSPSSSPLGAPPAPLPSFTLHANAHHVVSPQAGQLTPNLTLTHPHRLRSPTPLSPLLARAAIPIAHTDPLAAAATAGATATSASAATAASSSSSSLSSLLPRHSTWDRSRGLSSDLIRSLMATAEANEFKASLSNARNRHLGAFAAVSPDGTLPKDTCDKLATLDYDFTMTGLKLLAALLSSLTTHNKRAAIPRRNMPPPSVAPFERLASAPIPASTSSLNSDLLETASTAATHCDSIVADAASAPAPVAAPVAPAPALVSPSSVDSSSHLDTSTVDELNQTPSPTATVGVAAPIVADSASDGAAPFADAAPCDTSSAIESVVGLNLTELLQFAERSAASKSVQLTAARIECLRSSWPRSSDVDDWRFIELLFSSPLARAHTNLDKIIRRIGMLLQACYAEQLGVDLIMGEESEEQQQQGSSAAPAAGGAQQAQQQQAASALTGRKAKKKLKKKLKKKKNGAGSDKNDEAPNGSDEEDEAEAEDTQGNDSTADSTSDSVASSHSGAGKASGTILQACATGAVAAPTPSRSASAEPSCSAVVGLSPTFLSRSLSSHSASADNEPWQRVARKGERTSHSHSKAAPWSAHSTPPTKLRAKDDSYAEKQSQHAHSFKSLHTPPPPGRKPAGALVNHSKLAQHQHTNSQPSALSQALSVAAAAATPVPVSSSSASSTPAATSPHFSSSLSFSSFGARPSSWSAAASALRLRSSASTSASISPASTGQHTPTLAHAHPHAAHMRRAKDDSFAQQQRPTLAQRRSSGASLLMTNDARAPAATAAAAASPLPLVVVSASSSSSSSSPSASAAAHARHLSAGSVPALLSSPQSAQARLDDSHRSLAVPRSPLIKSAPSFSSSNFLLPHSPLLPTPPQAQGQQQQQQGASVAAPYSRTSSLHKPVPIHSSTCFSHHGPVSVGLSFSSVPAHGFTMAMQGQQQRRHANFAEYVHGTDDVTLQEWQQKHQTASALATHRRQQQQIKQYHQSAAILVHPSHASALMPPPSAHARVPRPSSARRVVVDAGACAASGAALASSSASASAATTPTATGPATRPRSNSEGEDGTRRQQLDAPLIEIDTATGTRAGSLQAQSTAPPAPLPSPIVPPPISVRPAPSPSPLPHPASSPLSPTAHSASAPPLLLPASVVSSHGRPSGGGGGGNNRGDNPLSTDSQTSSNACDANEPLPIECPVSHSSRDLDVGAGRPRAASSVTASPSSPVAASPSADNADAASVSSDAATPSASAAPVVAWADGHSVASSPAYHASVQTAQAYHKRNGMQFPPWLNASNLQLLAFIHNTSHATGNTPPHTRAPSGGANQQQQPQTQQAPSHGHSHASSFSSSASAPIAGELQRSSSQQGAVSQGGDSESRRPSLTSLMPNFLVLPNLPAQSATPQHSPTPAPAQTQTSSFGSPRTPSTPLATGGVPAHAQFIRVATHPVNAIYPGASMSPSPGSPARAGTAEVPSAASSSSPPASLCPAPFASLLGASVDGNWSLRDSWKLHDEICVFTHYVTDVTNLRQPILMGMIQRVRDCVHTLWPSATVECYGSFMTGLCLPTSDLDLVLAGVPVHPQQGLVQLSSVLRKQKSWLQSLNAISTAKVPVIKLLGVLEGEEIVVDITFAADHTQQTATTNATATTTNESNKPAGVASSSAPSSSLPSLPLAHTGVASVNLIRDYLRVFPALRPLSLVLKQFLYERGLANTYTGGLNSYCLILMIVSFLQSRPHPYHASAQAQSPRFTAATESPSHSHTNSMSSSSSGNLSSGINGINHPSSSGSNSSVSSNSSTPGPNGYVPVRIRAQLLSQMSSPPPYSPLAATTGHSRPPRPANSAVLAAVQRIEEREREAQVHMHVHASYLHKRVPSVAGPTVAMRLQQLQLQHTLAHSMSLSPSPSPSPSPSLPSMPSSPLQQSVAANSAGIGPAYRFPSPAPGLNTPSLNGAGGAASSSSPWSNVGGSQENLGSLLIELLHFYGCAFDFGSMAIAVHMPPSGSALHAHAQSSPSAFHLHPQSPAIPASTYNRPTAGEAATRASAAAASGTTADTTGAAPSTPSAPAPPPSVVGPGAPASLLLPTQRFNYLSLLQPNAPNLSFPSSATLADAQRSHAVPMHEEDLWGHGVYLSLCDVSRVLVISDPLYPLLSSNIGRSVFAMWRIKAAFDEGFRLLVAKFSPHGTAPTLLARIIQKMQQHHKKHGAITTAHEQQQQQQIAATGAPAMPTPALDAHLASLASASPSVASGSHSHSGSGSNTPRDPSANAAPVRGLFHITLPTFCKADT